MKVDFVKKTVGSFNYEFIRGVSAQSAGVAELGECIETMHHIKDGDFDSWIREWSTTADEVCAYASAALRPAGDVASARHAFLKASNYWAAQKVVRLLDDVHLV